MAKRFANVGVLNADTPFAGATVSEWDDALTKHFERNLIGRNKAVEAVTDPAIDFLAAAAELVDFRTFFTISEPPPDFVDIIQKEYQHGYKACTTKGRLIVEGFSAPQSSSPYLLQEAALNPLDHNAIHIHSNKKKYMER